MNKPLGTVYIIAAASGTGKTSLAKSLASSIDGMKISISHTTRPVRTGEQQNLNYFFVDHDLFESMIAANAFLEYARVFDHYYGTSLTWVQEQLQQGIDVILDIDWQGAQQVRKHLPCISIFLLPPSRDELKNRLETRKRDESAIIAQRLAMASSEISHYNEFDYVVINDKFDLALQDLQSIVRARRLLCVNQSIRLQHLLSELLAE